MIEELALLEIQSIPSNSYLLWENLCLASYLSASNYSKLLFFPWNFDECATASLFAPIFHVERVGGGSEVCRFIGRVYMLVVLQYTKTLMHPISAHRKVDSCLYPVFQLLILQTRSLVPLSERRPGQILRHWRWRSREYLGKTFHWLQSRTPQKDGTSRRRKHSKCSGFSTDVDDLPTSYLGINISNWEREINLQVFNWISLDT